MYWIIQNNMFSEEGFTKLISALDQCKLSYSLHKVVPFIHIIEPDVVPPPGPVIVMGTYSLCHIAQERGWNPGAFINDNLNFVKQREHWKGNLLNGDGFICKLENIESRPRPFFIRPIHDTKSFTGQVMDWHSFCEWRDRIRELSPEDNSTVTLDTEVLVNTTKDIYREYRLWIVNKNVVTGSLYKIGTIKRYEENIDSNVIEFANNMAQLWSPIDAYVMDVALTEDGYKIIEVNCLNSSGFYAGNMNKLVAALEETFG